ncbi:thiamine ABC transporter substrate-binding protein [Serinibacter arcticus]|uniref:Thiamine ABC transporter substrate-binding protein n=1 Tax=Serinibacter arcticus TaxID=1655435 RepID=A0A2U1ZV54_9MICO|nr:thiamine ABC transporter substrate-binding protein [Serinibacter arcticus]PWD50854.1 thiamine ABC transporter substrate-binding protein [Serinibacter arcticus]
MTPTTARPRLRRRPLIATAALTSASLLALAGCSLGGGSPAPSATSSPSDSATDSGEPSGEGASPSSSITLVTHDSFNLSEDVLAAFTEETGIAVTQVAPGDGGALVNQLVLTKASPLGDVVFGVDTTFASRAVDEGVFAPYTSPALPASAEQYLLGDALTPIDVSDVCLNVDLGWYEENGQEPPASFDDLVLPEYAGQTVVTNPATSSPGLAFLLATIGAKGESGWVAYWEQLRDNDVLVVDGWSDAYYVDFSGGEGEGERPVVLSYASSPPVTIGDDGVPTTAALLDTCFRQVEYAGVLDGAANPEGAQAFVDFLLSEPVQADVPEQMYVYPVDAGVELPADWAEFAPLASAPWDVPAADITANRSDWIDTWTQTVLG